MFILNWTQIHKLGQNTQQKSNSKHPSEWLQNRENKHWTISKTRWCLSCSVNVPPASANLDKTSVMLKCMNGLQNCHSRNANGTRNVAYFMTTGLGPVRATLEKNVNFKGFFLALTSWYKIAFILHFRKEKRRWVTWHSHMLSIQINITIPRAISSNWLKKQLSHIYVTEGWDFVWGFDLIALSFFLNPHLNFISGLLILKYSSCKLFIALYEGRTLRKGDGGDIYI